MNATKTNLTSLPPLQRRMADAWLARFEQGWNSQKLKEFLRSLPAESSLRQPLLQVMVQRDLDHHWQEGHEKTVEEYLHEYPELGSADDISIDLIAAEYHARERVGKVELSEYAERFPSRIDDLYVLLKPDLFDSAPTTGKYKADDTVAERRKQLLQTPANGETADAQADRRKMLLRTPSAEEIALPPEPTEAQPRTEVVSEMDLVLPPSALLDPQASQPAENQESQWVDIETIRKAAQQSAPPQSTEKPLPPPDFGHYRIKQRLGRGRSSVFEAIDAVMNRQVALKVPQLNGDLNEAGRARFQREARAAAAAYHPLLCPVLEIGQIDGIDYFAMPYVEGEPLSQVLQQRSVWPPRLAVIFITKLAMALDAAHRQNLIHRDLRPANILLTPSETPVIVGFASVAAVNVPVAPGEAAYLAPEHAQGDEFMGPQADIYSLGVLLFQLLTGNTPQEGLRESSFQVDLPQDLKDFCRKTLAVNPDDRPGNLGEFVKSLNGFLGKLRPSDFDVRAAALSGSAQGRMLAGSAMGLPPPAQPTAASPIANAAMSQMQELRQLSNWKSTPPSQRPVAKWHFPWRWCVGSALISAAIVFIAMAAFNRQPGTDGKDPGQANPPQVQVPTGPSLKELLDSLQKSPPPEKRTEILAKLGDRKNPADAKELDRIITENEWADPKEDSDAEKNAAFIALQAVDPAQLTKSLRAAIDSKNVRIRAWACDRIAISNDSTLLPEVRAALNDRHGLVRKAAADALRTMSPKDKETVEALERRIADDEWISKGFAQTREGNVGDPENGGKRAALDALKAIDMSRVPDALRKARESKNSLVKKWAEQELAGMK